MAIDKFNPIKFLGNGSAFNEELGNNSAFIKDEKLNKLLLIDCGSSVFGSLLKAGILNGVKEVNVLITHLHPDHVGSLGDLIFYNYYIRGLVTNVYYPDNNIVSLLTLMDVNREFYNHINKDIYSVMDMDISAVSQSHRGNQKAFGYLVRGNDFTFFYSGDANSIKAQILDMLLLKELDVLYQDVSTIDFEGNPHLSLNQLVELIPMNLRHKVVCMHLDNKFSREEVEKLGFSVSKSIFKE